MSEEKTLREQLEEAYGAVNESSEAEELAKTEDTETDEAGKENPAVEEGAETETVTDEEPAEDAEPEVPAPQSWKAEVKDAWKDLPKHVQAEIVRRENDFHKMVTANDGELRLGREMKEVISPYLATITAEGGNPTAAVKSLLNTAYVLRTAAPNVKAQMVAKIIDEYGVDLRYLQQQQEPKNDYLSVIQKELAELKKNTNPEIIWNQLQERQEADRIQAEVNAFSASHPHFKAVESEMLALLNGGIVDTLQEAYDRACWANPSIRSTLQNTDKTVDVEKRKKEIADKKSAASSIKGSPSAVHGNTTPPNRTLREELQANLASVRSSLI